MTKELIKTDNYLLVVDDSEIKDVRPYKGKWHLEKGYILNKFPVYLTDLSYCKIIIAHLPLNDSPILEGVPLLPLFEQEDDVEKLAEEEYPIIPNTSPNVNWDRANKQEGFERGYNKAREKYKFTEEHAKYLFECGRNFQINADITFTVAREHLSQPKSPTHFEFEMEEIYTDGFTEDRVRRFYSKQIKTTTNSQGQQVACGKYIY